MKPSILGLTAFFVLAVFLTAGTIFFLARPPQGEGITLLPPPTQPLLVVDISGAVASPGVYQFAPGTRLLAAVDAAGGLLDHADRNALNLAAPIEDGKKIVIPVRQPTPLPGAAPAPTPTPAPPTETTDRSVEVELPGLININTATQAELETLPRIGPVTAVKIIAYREEHGPFRTVEDLLDVSGIGEVTLEALRPLITTGE